MGLCKADVCCEMCEYDGCRLYLSCDSTPMSYPCCWLPQDFHAQYTMLSYRQAKSHASVLHIRKNGEENRFGNLIAFIRLGTDYRLAHRGLFTRQMSANVLQGSMSLAVFQPDSGSQYTRMSCLWCTKRQVYSICRL